VLVTHLSPHLGALACLSTLKCYELESVSQFLFFFVIFAFEFAFESYKEFRGVSNILLRFAEKTKKKFIFKAFEACDTCMMSFDLWMSKRVDIFVLIVHFLNHNGELGYVIIGLFKTAKTSKGYRGHTSE